MVADDYPLTRFPSSVGRALQGGLDLWRSEEPMSGKVQIPVAGNRIAHGRLGRFFLAQFRDLALAKTLAKGVLDGHYFFCALRGGRSTWADHR